MKLNLILILYPFLLLLSCGLLKSGIENGMEVYAHGIVPDTCDFKLITAFVDFREDSLIFPKYSWVVDKIQLQSTACQASFDSVNIVTFGVDSADLFVIKNFTNKKNERYSLRKYYRFRFSQDTLSSISPNLITTKDKYY
jgi:hypothetical protein